LGPAVDDNLWGVDAFEHEDLSILSLALGVVGSAEGVFPAQAIPIIYMKTKDIDTGGVGCWEGGYEIVGRGATGAAFGGKEFYESEAVIGGGKGGRAACRGTAAEVSWGWGK